LAVGSLFNFCPDPRNLCVKRNESGRQNRKAYFLTPFSMKLNLVLFCLFASGFNFIKQSVI
jgi:hypothetical protein